MAEGDEDAKTGTTPGHADKVEPLSSEHPSAPIEPTLDEPLTVASSPSSKPPTEWTASDARGPLMEADGVTPVAASSYDDAEPAAPVSSSSGGTRQQTTGAAPAEAPRRSSWPIAAGLVAGAVVGAVVALWVYPAVHSDPGSGPDVAALSAKVAALEAKPSADAPITALQTQVASLQKQVGNLPKASPAPVLAFDPAPLEKEISAIKGALDAQRQQTAGIQALGDKTGALEAAVATLQKQADISGKGLQAVQDQQKSLEGKVGAPALAVVADSLVQQIDEGQPYAMQVDALASLGADATKLAVLKQNAQTGVPSAKALAGTFAPLAEPILATEHKAPPDASFVERLKSGMSSLVSIRRSDDVSGGDLSSRVGRIQADLAHDDVADAVATWAGLPADAKAKSQNWGALAKTSAEAMTAARGLQNEAIAAMGGKKS